METLKSSLFIICSSLFLLHLVLQHLLKINIPLADAYLDNLLAMPVVLTLLLAERRHFFNKGISYQLPLLEIFLATAYVSAISEWLFPWISKRFTFDPLDFLFFFLGAGIFYLVHNKRGN
jgi:hypothetical protein